MYRLSNKPTQVILLKRNSHETEFRRKSTETITQQRIYCPTLLIQPLLLLSG